MSLLCLLLWCVVPGYVENFCLERFVLQLSMSFKISYWEERSIYASNDMDLSHQGREKISSWSNQKSLWSWRQLVLNLWLSSSSPQTPLTFPHSRTGTTSLAPTKALQTTQHLPNNASSTAVVRSINRHRLPSQRQSLYSLVWQARCEIISSWSAITAG